MKRKEWLLLLLLLSIGFALRLNHLSERSLWTDEFFTLFQSSGHGTQIKALLDSLAGKSEPAAIPAIEFKRLLRNDPDKNINDVNLGLLNTDTHPPFYFLAMHFWMRLFSDSPLSVRFFSVIFGMISIILAYQLGCRLFNKQAGFFCGLIVSVSAFCVRYSQEARAYSLIMCMGLASLLLLLRLEEEDRYSDGLLLGLVNALGIYTHYFYIFIAFAQFVYFTLAHHRQTNLLRRFYLFFLLSLLSLSFWFIPLIIKGYNFYLTEWVFGYPGIKEKLMSILLGLSRYLFIVDKPGSPIIALLWVLCAWFAYNFLGAAFDMFKRYRNRFWFCMSMFILPLSAIFFIDLIENGALMKQERFWMFVFPGFMPLAGYALSLAFLRSRLSVFVFALCMLGSASFVSSLNFGPAPKSSSEWINKADIDGKSCVVIYNIRSAVLSQVYYLNDRIGILPVATEEQLKGAIKHSVSFTDRVFICRHYHRTDASLMDQQFMGADKMREWGFLLKEGRLLDDIGVFEYTRR
ncbi:MAG: glycosyltransferase family 39 protein [Candidatus Omnitrophota bacterium]